MFILHWSWMGRRSRRHYLRPLVLRLELTSQWPGGLMRTWIADLYPLPKAHKCIFASICGLVDPSVPAPEGYSDPFHSFILKSVMMERLTLCWRGSGMPRSLVRCHLWVSVHVFPEEMSLWISRLSKEDPPSPSWAGIPQPIEDPNRTKRQRGVEFALSLSSFSKKMFY